MLRSLKKLFGGEEEEEKIIAAPVNGATTPMGQVSDLAFDQEILGKGTAIIPSDGRVVTPADELATMVFDTRYVIGMQTDNGAELITHIGLNTVQPKGQYFEVHVAAEDRVKQGDLLLDFEIDKIKETGYDVTTPVIIYNTPQFPKMERGNRVEVETEEMAIIKL